MNLLRNALEADPKTSLENHSGDEDLTNTQLFLIICGAW